MFYRIELELVGALSLSLFPYLRAKNACAYFHRVLNLLGSQQLPQIHKVYSRINRIDPSRSFLPKRWLAHTKLPPRLDS